VIVSLKNITITINWIRNWNSHSHWALALEL